MTLGDRRADAQHALYVGRDDELAQIAGALRAEALPFHIVHVYGPGGIGKTSLLDEVARLAAGAGVPAGRVDGRDLEATPGAFEAAADAAWGGAGAGRRVLLVDTYERIEALDAWMRRTFVPALRATDLVVIAGRQRPAAEWHAEWGRQLRQLPLRDLSADEARSYLCARGVPDGALDEVTAFTHGHPLALALAADYLRQRGEAAAFDLGRAPDLVADLLSRFVTSVPSPAHRAALEGAAVVRSLTVPLLRALLAPDEGGPDADEPDEDEPDADDLFGWLRGLAFVRTDADGIRLHDVVRETVEADLRWRDPDRHGAVHARARRYYGARLRALTLHPAQTDSSRQTLASYLDLYRHNPVVRPLLRQLGTSRRGATPLSTGPLRHADADRVRELAARHHGPAEAAAVAGWLACRPSAAEGFYDGDGALQGFLLTLDLAQTTDEERAADPVAAAAWGAVRDRHREGERALLFRSWLDDEAGQGVSVVQSLVFARTVEHYLTTPELATSVLLTSEPALWGPVLSFAGLAQWPDAEQAEAGAAEAGLAAFGMDWRAVPPAAWLDALAERTPGQAPPPDPADTLVVLSNDAFADAVRDALRAYARPHRLAESPLVRARLVRARGGDPVESLRQLIAAAAAQLDRAPRERPYFRALDQTYLRPAPTQAEASERLGVPFSTYRRHLGRGVDHVVEALWRAETGDDPSG